MDLNFQIISGEGNVILLTYTVIIRCNLEINRQLIYICVMIHLCHSPVECTVSLPCLYLVILVSLCLRAIYVIAYIARKHKDTRITKYKQGKDTVHSTGEWHRWTLRCNTSSQLLTCFERLPVIQRSATYQAKNDR